MTRSDEGIVYMLGAGFNAGEVDSLGWRPPLTRELFRVVCEHYADPMRESYATIWHENAGMRGLLAYIERYWGLTADDLCRTDFDLEECLTFIELQRRHAAGAQRAALDRHERTLLSTLMVVLLRTTFPYWDGTEPHGVFAQRALAERATIITFNYDTIVEDLLERASRWSWDDPRSNRWRPLHEAMQKFRFEGGPLPVDLLDARDGAWNRNLGYGFEFAALPVSIDYVSGEDYYAHPENRPCATTLLKLHGSVNWFHRTGVDQVDYYRSDVSLRDIEALEERGVVRVDHGYDEVRDAPPTLDGVVLKPIVVPPIVDKRNDTPPLDAVWRQARTMLRSCRRLVVIGYSLPATDFQVAWLLRESFADNRLEALDVINPDETVVDRLMRLIRFGKVPRWFPTLPDYCTVDR